MTIDPKCDHTLCGVLITKIKTLSNTFALISIGFCFSLSSFSRWALDHLLVITMHHDHLLSSITWIIPTSLIHTLSIEVRTKVSSISQNQTRAFNLPLFGNWWHPFSQRFSIKFFWIHVACPNILPCVKIMDKLHQPKLVVLSPHTYVLRV
jgi:hypothetical protein